MIIPPIKIKVINKRQFVAMLKLLVQTLCNYKKPYDYL